MRNFILSLFFLSLLISCKNDAKDINIHKYKFDLIDSIRLPIPKYVSSEGRPSTYVLSEDKTDNLYVLARNSGRKQSEILIYDLNTESLIDTIELPYEGPNSYKRITGIAIKNRDSIYAVSFFDTNLYLLNSKGELVNTYSLKYETNNRQVKRILPSLRRPMHLFNNAIYFTPEFSGFFKTEDGLKQSITFKYDFKTDSLINLNFTFPRDYAESNSFETKIPNTIGNNKFVYAPETSNEIWVTNSDHKNIKRVDSKSDFFQSFRKITRTNNTTGKDPYFDIVFNSKYNSIVYDKYRKVYYRFCYPGNRTVKKGSEMVRYLSQNLDVFSIIVLDKDFLKLDEILMPKDTYVFENYFVDRSGLNINANHVNNKFLEEDYMVYHTFKFTAK